MRASTCPGRSTTTRWSTCSPGHGTVGDDQVAIQTGNLAVLGAGDFVTVKASGSQESRTPALDVLVIGGKPIREPVAWAGPFVMNTKAEVMTAFEDFQKGRLGTIPSVHGAPTTLTTTDD